MLLGLLCSMASRPPSRSRRCRLQLKVSPREPVKLVVVLTGHTAREPVVMHPRVWDHEVPLVMSQVIQATGRRILHTWVVAPCSPSRILENHSFVLRGPDRVGVSRLNGDFRLFATWRSDSALSSESSKNACQWHFIRAEGSSNGSWRSRRALQPTCRSRRALEPGCSESASGIWNVISSLGIAHLHFVDSGIGIVTLV